MDPLAENLQAFGAVGTLAVAVIAAIVAFFQFRESARLRYDQSRPYVVVYLERVAPSILDVVVKNFGSSAARDVELDWDRPVMMRWQNDPEPLALVQQIALLAPAQEWRTLWDVNGHRLEDNEEPYEMRVSSRDPRGRHLPVEAFELTTRHYEHALMRDQNGMHELGEEMKAIRRIMSQWSDSGGGMQIWTRSGKKKDRRRRERIERWRRRHDKED